MAKHLRMVLKAVNGYGLGDWFMGILPGTNYCREVHQHRTVDNVARRVETRFSYAGPFVTVAITGSPTMTLMLGYDRKIASRGPGCPITPTYHRDAILALDTALQTLRHDVSCGRPGPDLQGC